jgi:uncharacterized protein YqgC (DUF456 family)
MSQKTKWLLYSIGGLLLLGLGLSLLGEAIIQKGQQTAVWVHWGTLALILTNTGVCLVGQAVIEKIKWKSWD